MLRLVREMLAGESRPVEALDRPVELEAAARAPLDRVGPYEIVGVLGEGGMGVVYEARQATPRRTVALKLLRSSFASEQILARFRDEAEVLGWLDHPGIASVYDAGTATVQSSEVPYMAMELVRGERIDAFVERNAPSVEARLELVARLAEIVHHAHQKGVVHRDLKPANVLVTEDGSLKVLDFGIARITDADLSATTRHTRTGELLGTLPYMSPEQVGADPARVDLRSDVYALGVIAYELLSGRRPVDVGEASLPEAARRISEVEPTALGQLDPRLAGDVELVVGKALAKEKEQRYASADELARDLRRKLADEPVLARAPSRAYRAAKFVRRHRGLVVGLAAAALLMAAGTAAATAQYLDKSKLLDRRADEAETAARAVGFLEDILDQADPFSGDELSVREVTRLAVARLEGEFLDRPVLRARMLQMLGRTLKNLGVSEEALPLLEEAVELCEAHHGPRSRELGEALATLGRVRSNLGDSDNGIGEQGRALEILRAEGPSRLLAETLSEIASSCMDHWLLDEARAFQEEGLAMCVELFGEDDRETLSIRNNVGVRLMFEGRLEDSERELKAVLARMPEVSSRANTLLSLSRNLRMQRRLEESEQALREALVIAEQAYGREGNLSREILRQLGNVLTDRGQLEEAVAIQREVREIVHRRVGASTPEGLAATHDLAFVVHDLPQKREAEGLYLEVIEGLEQLGCCQALLFQAQHNLSMLYWALGDLDSAEELERASLDGRIAAYGEADSRTLASWRGLGDILVKQGRIGEAIDLRTRIVELCEETFGNGSANTQAERLKLADVLVREQLFEPAEEVLLRCESALDEMPDRLGFPKQVAGRLAGLYRVWGRTDEAERWRAEEAAR